ncbi:unnamed protein product [Prorocentrum cordatum]|uniref:Condensin complex subunit 2 n=1 Tax=Prorocentrum cordatum TaxID=2364126 RepID=A0ABN9R8Z1_9DINO|nr:unnamed protein product [Polarella glacialis]
MAFIDLSTLVGEWADSEGNDVHASFGRSGLLVSMSGPRLDGEESAMVVRKAGPFACSFHLGHYELSQEESTHASVVWRDSRGSDNITVWTRRNCAPENTAEAPPPPPGMPHAPARPVALPQASARGDRWSQVLSEFAAARGEAAAAPEPRGAAAAGEEPWSDVLDLLAAAAGCGEAAEAAGSEGGPAAGSGGGDGAQAGELFSPFGLQPRVAPKAAPASQAVRGQVLQETIARLLREKQSSSGPRSRAQDAAQASGGTPRWAPARAEHRAAGQAAGAPVGASPQRPSGPVPWRRLEPQAAQATSSTEAPIEKFIRVFALDELAAKSLRALEDDEAAFLIESVQGRLQHAKNPSAVTMSAIRNVASKVGRRYWGNRETGDVQSTPPNRPDGVEGGQLQMFLGSPPASPEAFPDTSAEAVPHTPVATDPYLAAADPYQELESPVVVDLVDDDDGDGAHLEGSAAECAEDENQLAPEQAPASSKRRRVEGVAFETTAASPLLEQDDAHEEVEDDEDSTLFFVDTGPPG